MFTKVKYVNDEERERWASVMKLEFMSSEESGTDDGEDANIVRPLPWLSEHVMQFKKLLDDEISEDRTLLSRRKPKKCIVGSPSIRSKPQDATPDWAFN